MDRTFWPSSMASEVPRHDTFGLLPLGAHEEFNLRDSGGESETEMDLVGRIVAAAGCIADDPGVFDRVQESILR